MHLPGKLAGTTRTMKLLAVRERFPDGALMSAFGILAMRPISLLSEEELTQFGAEKLEMLLGHYGAEQTHTWKEGDPSVHTKKSSPLVDAQATREEWIRAKTTVHPQHYPRGTITALWTMMVQHHADDFPNLCKLAAYAISCPVQTADCERSFSAQNRILTALRNRLTPKTQNKPMTVKLGKVNPVEALAAWKAAKPRSVWAPRKVLGNSGLEIEWRSCQRLDVRD